MHPTVVYGKLVSEEATPFVGFAVDLMRRFYAQSDWTIIDWWCRCWMPMELKVRVFFARGQRAVGRPASFDERQMRAATEWLSTQFALGTCWPAEAPPSSTPPA